MGISNYYQSVCEIDVNLKVPIAVSASGILVPEVFEDGAMSMIFAAKRTEDVCI
jgi:hypothetical protein